MKKLLLLATLIAIAATAWSAPFEQCVPGTKVYLGEVDFTVTEVHPQGFLMGSIREDLFPIVDHNQELLLGDHLRGYLYSRCVDIGHIPGRQTYWTKYLVVLSERE